MTESVGDVKSNIAKANDTTRDCVAVLGQALSTLSEARSQLSAAVAGSPHADVSDALNVLNGAAEKIREAQQAVARSIGVAEDVAARL